MTDPIKKDGESWHGPKKVLERTPPEGKATFRVYLRSRLPNIQAHSAFEAKEKIMRDHNVGPDDVTVVMIGENEPE